MTFTRLNSIGLTFHISGHPSEETVNVQLSHTTKNMTYPVNINEFSQMWYDWQMGGQFIQTAFRRLTAEQREFLITGMTPEDWAKTFPIEEVDD